MRAAVVSSFEDSPKYGSFDDPEPQPGEVLVTVTAAGLHQIVRSLAKGTHYLSRGILPFVPGIDGVGRLEDGRRVYFGSGRSPFGSMAERSVTRPETTLPLPDVLSDELAAAIINPGMSSWAALRMRIQFSAGESVLILGATGTSGLMAVQIARRLGARRVVAAGRNAEALEEARHLGADATISLNVSLNQEREAIVAAMREELQREKIDVVLDYLWGGPAECLLEAIAAKGGKHTGSRVRYLQIGSGAGATVPLAASVLRSTGLELMGSGFGSVSMQDIFAVVAEFLSEAARKPFAIRTRTVPLSAVEAEWNAPEDRGRLVFMPSR